MTHELVASAFGVRRESITDAAGKLQRAGLEAGACECYAVVKHEFSRLLSDVQYRQGPPL